MSVQSAITILWASSLLLCCNLIPSSEAAGRQNNNAGPLPHNGGNGNLILPLALDSDQQLAIELAAHQHQAAQTYKKRQRLENNRVNKTRRTTKAGAAAIVAAPPSSYSHSSSSSTSWIQIGDGSYNCASAPTADPCESVPGFNLLPLPPTCKQYMLCSDRKLSLMFSCAEGTVFDHLVKRCVSEELADCPCTSKSSWRNGSGSGSGNGGTYNAPEEGVVMAQARSYEIDHGIIDADHGITSMTEDDATTFDESDDGDDDTGKEKEKEKVATTKPSSTTRPQSYGAGKGGTGVTADGVTYTFLTVGEYNNSQNYKRASKPKTEKTNANGGDSSASAFSSSSKSGKLAKDAKTKKVNSEDAFSKSGKLTKSISTTMTSSGGKSSKTSAKSSLESSLPSAESEKEKEDDPILPPSPMPPPQPTTPIEIAPAPTTTIEIAPTTKEPTTTTTNAKPSPPPTMDDDPFLPPRPAAPTDIAPAPTTTIEIAPTTKEPTTTTTVKPSPPPTKTDDKSTEKAEVHYEECPPTHDPSLVYLENDVVSVPGGPNEGDPNVGYVYNCEPSGGIDSCAGGIWNNGWILTGTCSVTVTGEPTSEPVPVSPAPSFAPSQPTIEAAPDIATAAPITTVVPTVQEVVSRPAPSTPLTLAPVPAPSGETRTCISGSEGENFETGTYPATLWKTTTGEENDKDDTGVGWSIHQGDTYEGQYSIKSPDLTNAPTFPATSNATIATCEDFAGGFMTLGAKASVLPPADVFVIYVDGVKQMQLIDVNEWEVVTVDIPPGEHEVAFSYQYNMFNVMPLPPSPPTREGAVYIDDIRLTSAPSRSKLVMAAIGSIFQGESSGGSLGQHCLGLISIFIPSIVVVFAWEFV